VGKRYAVCRIAVNAGCKTNYPYERRQYLMRAKFDQLKKKGQGLVEYALILVLIAIVVILILTFLGSKVNSTFSRIGSGLG
jgi:pilus assembly protein Flp/PilA